MQTLLAMFHAATLLAIAWQDFRSRSVWWVLLAACIALTFAEGWLLVGSGLLPLAGLNLALMGAQLLVLKLVFSIKNKENTAVADKLLGWGDILFFAVPCLYFSVFNFVVFYVLSLLVVLLAFILWKRYKPNTPAEVPLAGGMALLLLLARIPEHWWQGYGRYHDKVTHQLLNLY